MKKFMLACSKCFGQPWGHYLASYLFSLKATHITLLITLIVAGITRPRDGHHIELWSLYSLIKINTSG